MTGLPTIICAQQDTARALGFTEHLWLPTGAIAGPIIVTKLLKGAYASLGERDISLLKVRLGEFDITGEHVHRIVTDIEEQQARRGYSVDRALNTEDDLTAVLRMHAEIEQLLWERILPRLTFAHQLRKERFAVSQLSRLAAALDVIPQDMVELISGLAEIRNDFAHKPGYVPAARAVDKLTRLAPETKPFTDLSFIETFMFHDRSDNGAGFSNEAVQLRVLFYVVILRLDPSFEKARDA
jgi:hypothetical protein